MGFKPEKVAELVSRTFNEMIFIHGDVQCDPHAANLFLRKNEATGQLQLVLLDHGLYRQAPSIAAMCLLSSNFLDHMLALPQATSKRVTAKNAFCDGIQLGMLCGGHAVLKHEVICPAYYEPLQSARG